MFENEKNAMISIGAIMAFIIVVVFGHGYSNKIDDVTKVNAKRAIAKYDKLETKLLGAQTKLKQSDIYKQTSKIYTTRNLDGSYADIKSQIVSFDSTVKKLRTLIKEDTMWSQDDTYALTRLINNRISTFDKKIGQPRLELVTIKRNIDDLIKRGGSEKELATITKSYNTFNKMVKAQKAKHKNRIADINKITDKFKNRMKELTTYDKVISKNLKLKYDMNYSQFNKINQLFTTVSKKIKTELIVDTETIMSLDKSYSKMLTDMKADYAIKFGYSTWDANAEWDNTRNGMTSPKRMTEKEYYKIIEANDLVMKCRYTGFFSRGSKCDQYVMYAQKHLGTNIPRGNTTIEYWVGGTDSKFYHRYTIEKDGKTTKTDWQKVTEEFYWANHKNLGMALESKPMGSFTNETLKQATPPGMAYVGNQNYGSYNSSGSWIFLPMFMNNYGSYGYDRNDHSNYRSYRDNRNNRSGYYGRNNSFGTYGKRTYSKGSRFVKPTNTYRKSTVSRTGARTNNSMNRTSRSFGSKSRGRGAGGGGK